MPINTLDNFNSDYRKLRRFLSDTYSIEIRTSGSSYIFFSNYIEFKDAKLPLDWTPNFCSIKDTTESLKEKVRETYGDMNVLDIILHIIPKFQDHDNVWGGIGLYAIHLTHFIILLKDAYDENLKTSIKREG